MNPRALRVEPGKICCVEARDGDILKRFRGGARMEPGTDGWSLEKSAESRLQMGHTQEIQGRSQDGTRH